MVESDVFIKSENIELEDLGGGITRQILGYNPDLMMVRVFFKKGAVGEAHSHPHRQVSYVEKGKFEVHIDGKKQILGVGDSFFVPRDLVHGCTALEDGCLLDVFTPIRQEFVASKNGK